MPVGRSLVHRQRPEGVDGWKLAGGETQPIGPLASEHPPPVAHRVHVHCFGRREGSQPCQGHSCAKSIVLIEVAKGAAWIAPALHPAADPERLHGPASVGDASVNLGDRRGIKVKKTT